MKTKRAKVIMLPTEEKTQIVGFSDMSFRLRKKMDETFVPECCFHLYITTNDEIKEGWVIDNDNELKYVSSSVINTKTGIARHLDDTPFILDGCKKIIATTDKSLTLYNESEYINSSPYVKYLPKPSQAFIEKYCKEGGIDKVLVEYGGNHQEFLNYCSDIGFSYDSAFGWYENSNPGHRPNTSTLMNKFNSILKINSHNEITIHSIKDTWTREEVEKLCKLAHQNGWASNNNYTEKHGLNPKYSINNWIKENL